MDFGDILNQWDNLCAQEEESQKARQKGSNKPRPRLPNAPHVTNPREEKVSTKKAKTNQEDNLSSVNPMDYWLRQHEVIDKDAMAKEADERAKGNNREYLKKMPICARIDLHGLTRNEAWARLDNFVSDCCRRGLKKILIVHGKGYHSKEKSDVSILSAMVRNFIELDSRLGASGHPDKKLGGSGATWVIIKNEIKTCNNEGI